MGLGKRFRSEVGITESTDPLGTLARSSASHAPVGAASHEEFVHPLNIMPPTSPSSRADLRTDTLKRSQASRSIPSNGVRLPSLPGWVVVSTS